MTLFAQRFWALFPVRRPPISTGSNRANHGGTSPCAQRGETKSVGQCLEPLSRLRADFRRRVRSKLRLLPFLAGCLVSLIGRPVWALQDDARQPLLIEADAVEVRESDSTSVYVGHVQMDQGSMRLLADHVTVYHRENRQPRLMIALGAPASYKQQLDDRQGEVQAFAKRMEYDADRDELLLLGEGLLIQGADRLVGERIVYERARGRFRAGGEARVKITITPKSRQQ